MRIESDDCYRLGQHYACDGCGCQCHPRHTTQPISIPALRPTGPTWTPDRDDAA